MKTLRLILPLLLLIPTLHAAAPRFYVTGQIGRFEADAGTVEGAGYYPAQFAVDRSSPIGQNSIKSGTKTFYEFSLGADFNRWFSLETGYASFNSFLSPWMDALPPGTESFVPLPVFRLDHRLRVYRITPILSLPLAEHWKLTFLGGFTHSAGKIITWKLERLPSPFNTYEKIRTMTNSEDSYHLGTGLDWSLAKALTIGVRLMYYDFGKVSGKPRYTSLGSPPVPSPGNRITAMTYSLGLSWHF